MSIDDLIDTVANLDIVDLSHEMYTGMPVWPTLPGFEHQRWISMDAGQACNADRLIMTDHAGTHLDAPAHYVPDTTDAHGGIHEVPLRRCLGRGVRIDCRSVPPDAEAGLDRITDWEATHGPIRAGDLVLFDFGVASAWAEEPPTRVLKAWPGLATDAVDGLVGRRVAAVGVDSLSVDRASNTGDPCHHTLLKSGVLIAENLANLTALPATFLVMMLPLKIRHGSGSPVRAVAFVPRGTAQ